MFQTVFVLVHQDKIKISNVFQIVFVLVHQDKLNYQCVSNSVEGKWPVIPPLQETTVSRSSIIVDDINL